MARRNQCLQFWVARLQGRIAAHMVAVQMGVEHQVQRPALQSGVNQQQGLFAVGAVTAIDQCAVVGTGNDDVVTGEPAALQHADALRQIQACHAAQAKARWMMIFCTSEVPS